LNDKEELIMSFPSIYSCAKYLGVNRYRVYQSLKLNKPIECNDQVYYVNNNEK